MKKFKVGDKVKVVKTQADIDDKTCWVDSMDKFIGKVLVVERINRDDASVTLIGGEDWIFPKGSLIEAPKFKVGDEVKVVQSYTSEFVTWPSEMNIFIGKVGVISEIDEEREFVRIRNFTNYHSSEFSFSFSSIELTVCNYIDGIEVSREEFERRTAAPIKMTWEEIEVKLGYKIELK